MGTGELETTKGRDASTFRKISTKETTLVVVAPRYHTYGM